MKAESTEKIQISEKKSRHILAKSKLPGLDYCINPYVGCQHACVYCYACFMRRFSGHENEVWGRFVEVKSNAVELIPSDSRQLRWNDVLFFGSVTDAYQPVEKEYRLTRGILEFFARYPDMNLEISILTKSDLVVRDIDLLQTLPHVSVGFSLALLDERAREIFEPGAAPIDRRLDALRILSEAGIETFVFMAPILPGITPLRRLFDRIAGITNSIHGDGLNCRCGNLPSIFQAISRYDSNLLPEFRRCITNSNYWTGVEHEFRQLATERNIQVQGFYHHDDEPLS